MSKMLAESRLRETDITTSHCWHAAAPVRSGEELPLAFLAANESPAPQFVLLK